MNTEIVTEKVIDPAKGIPVLIMDLVMLVASVVLMCAVSYTHLRRRLSGQHDKPSLI